jgi:ribosomal protein S18 acetylase RimI-like enzyme
LRNKGGQVAGYIIASISNGNGKIDSLAGDPNFRRLGVAKKLVLAALENFREKGISTAIA